MARDRALSFNLKELLADKEAAHEFLREYAGLEIADKIRILRESHDLTQADLAETLGTTQSAIARLEDVEYRKYSLATLQRVAEAFNLWPSVVFELYQTVIARILAGRDIGDRQDTVMVHLETSSLLGGPGVKEWDVGPMSSLPTTVREYSVVA